MFNFSNLEIHSPWFLTLFLLFIPIFIRDIRKKKQSGIAVPTIQNMNQAQSISLVLTFLKVSKYIILGSIIIALARPRSYSISENRDDTKGIDIMLSVDVSLSMLSKDLEPDRLTALKEIATDFVNQRTNDRIGLVEYAAEAYTKVPVTSDHQVVIDELHQLDPLELEPGTSIGDGLAVAVNHLKNSKAKSKIIILMTDGKNTVQNAMPPEMAAEMAKNNHIKVYTIGIGTNGYALMPTEVDIFGNLVFNDVRVEIDEPVLRQIADITGGKYFHATSNRSLKDVYDDINKLEKSDNTSTKFYNYEEYFRVFLWIALATLVLDALLRWIFYKILD